LAIEHCQRDWGMLNKEPEQHLLLFENRKPDVVAAETVGHAAQERARPQE
jgi:hypothetical protein